MSTVQVGTMRSSGGHIQIGCVDFVSNSLFPAIAAEELGFFRAEGVSAHVELMRTPIAFQALRDGHIELLAAPAHAVLRFFPQWGSAKLVVALQQGTPWLAVLRHNLPASRGEVTALKGLRLAVAASPNQVFRQLLADFGLEPDRDVEIVDLPGSQGTDVNFGMFAARALHEGLIDGFFANAMGAEISIQSGIGKILIDVRRDGDRFRSIRELTFPALITTDDIIARSPTEIASIVRAVVKAQKALRSNPARATEVGNRRFPPDAAERIATLVERDLPFYVPSISEEAAASVSRFGQSLGLLETPLSYRQMVAEGFRHLWAELAVVA